MGLERTSYTVSESDEVVEICINAAGANTDCPSSDPFQLTLIKLQVLLLTATQL